MNYKYDINNYRINRDNDHHVIGGKEYKAVDGAIAIFCTKDGDSDPLTLAEKSVTLFGQPLEDGDTQRIWKNTAGDITLTVDKDKTFTVDEAVTPTGLTGYTCKVYKVFAAGDKFTELDTQGLGKKAFVEELAAEAVDAPWEFGSLGEKSAQLVGTNAKAQAEGAVAEGKDTIASGAQSHAEGNQTKATGEASHAEGKLFIADDGTVYQTTASGEGAHAEGIGTTASGKGSHAGGKRGIASGDYSFAQTTGEDNPMWEDLADYQGITITDAEAKGEGSIVTGSGYASGKNSIALGYSVEHGEDNEENLLLNNAVIVGDEMMQNIVAGQGWLEGTMIAGNVVLNGYIGGEENFGNLLGTSDENAIEGSQNFSNTLLQGSRVNGDQNMGNVGFAANNIQGNENRNNTLLPFGQIYGNQNQGNISCCEIDGDGNQNNTFFTSGFQSVTDTVRTLAAGSGKVGKYNESCATFGRSELGDGTGTGIQKTLNFAFAEGYSKASANTAHAEGGIFEVYPDNRMRAVKTEASGLASHAEGATSVASGEGAHAEGGYVHFDNGTNKPRTSTAEGNASHAEGYNTYAKGRGAHAEGLYTRALNIGEHACGIGNVTNDDTIFTVGIGVYAADDKDATPDANMQYILEGQRMNAIQVHYSTGDQYVYGIGNFQGKSFAIIPDPEHIGATITVNLGDTIKNADGTDYINPLTGKVEHWIKPVQEVIEIQNARIKHLEDLIEHLTEIIEP